MSDLAQIIKEGFSEWNRGYFDCEHGQDEDKTGCKMYKDGYRKRLKELADEDVRVG